MRPLRIAVLASGSGSNFQALIDNKARFHGTIEVLISDNKNAYALQRAKDHGIKAIYLEKENYNQRLKTCLENHQIDLVVLAGYLKKLPVEIVHQFKTINIHPSLLPAYGGKGFYGLRVHEAVLAAKEKVTGATVHLVDANLDTGPILLQKTVAVQPDDTPETLQKRVLEIEHELLPLAVEQITHNREGTK